MRISHWSSDVCSSDLAGVDIARQAHRLQPCRHSRDDRPLRRRRRPQAATPGDDREVPAAHRPAAPPARSEEHTSELQSLMRISYAVFCLKKKTRHLKITRKESQP